MLGNLLMDTYDRKARLYPAILAVVPVAIFFVILLGPDQHVMEAIGTIIVAGGGAFLVCNISRDAGDRIQQALFDQWGGLPSVVIMRHADSRIDRLTKARYHKALAKWVAGTKAPSADQEGADPVNADATYVAWSHYLRVRTRDVARFPLVAVENINFGYRNNVLGLRNLGIVCALSALGAIVMLAWISGPANRLFALQLLAIGAMLIDAAFWILVVKPAWVKQAGDAYAARLIEAVEFLGD